MSSPLLLKTLNFIVDIDAPYQQRYFLLVAVFVCNVINCNWELFQPGSNKTTI